ncbi:MAG: hypothetical protein LC751_20370 [Actinobacteria bacterium]|nr:hypothetical protein [Actinomycetota bacterium]
MRFLENLNRPATVLWILGLLIIVNGFLFYRYQVKVPNTDEASSGNKETTSSAGSSTEIGGAGYVQNVGDIQNAAVQTFTRINDRVRRYDTLTVDDTEAIEADNLALETYSAQAQDLDVPEEYKGQHELFSGAIGDLYAAAEIAQRVTAAPISATPADFGEYDNRVAEATSDLEQSNEVLGQDYSTTAGLPKVGSLAF